MSVSSTPVYSWDRLFDELGLWRKSRRTASFWLRDDDAVEETPPLRRLADVAGRFGVDIGLAVVPGNLADGFADHLRDKRPYFFPMCHGWKHIDYGKAGKPGEFGADRPLREVADDATKALAEFRRQFEGVPAIFVPPYGRIVDALTAALPGIGFQGVSSGPTPMERRLARAVSRLGSLPAIGRLRTPTWPRFDVHVDPYDWSAGRARSPAAIEQDTVGYLRLRRLGFVPSTAPIGLLLHHLAFDDETWTHCDGLLRALVESQAVTFPAMSHFIQRGLESMQG